MSNKKTNPNNLDDAFGDVLKEYGNEIIIGVKKEVKEAGKDAVKELKANSPKKTGDYRKGWTSKVTEEKAHMINVTVYNKTEYQLAHLLEFGHIIVQGGRTKGKVKAYPHIADAEEKVANELEKKIEIIIKKG